MMSTRMRCCVFGLALCVLAGCQKAEEPASSPTQQQVPTSTEPAAPPPATATPSPSSAHEVIRFDGFGPAHFGDGEEAVRIAWGAPLERSGSEDSCRQLFTSPVKASLEARGLSFMLVDGKFARYDVDTAAYRAPGGIAVGDPAAKVDEVHAGRVEKAPHKYVEGAQTLTVTPKDGQTTRLVIETSADGTITRWRVGEPPAVFFVEGCS